MSTSRKSEANFTTSDGNDRDIFVSPRTMKQPVLELLVERKLSLLLEENPDATAEIAMGRIVSEYFGYNAARILEVAASALEDAEFRATAKEIRAICKRVMERNGQPDSPTKHA